MRSTLITTAYAANCSVVKDVDMMGVYAARCVLSSHPGDTHAFCSRLCARVRYVKTTKSQRCKPNRSMVGLHAELRVHQTSAMVNTCTAITPHLLGPIHLPDAFQDNFPRGRTRFPPKHLVNPGCFRGYILVICILGPFAFRHARVRTEQSQKLGEGLGVLNGEADAQIS